MNLYGLAGQGMQDSGFNVGSGIADSVLTGGGFAMMNPATMPYGLAAMVLGGAAKGILAPFTAASARERGEAAYNQAKAAYDKRIADHPGYYSTQNVTNAFAKAKADMIKSNSQANSALLDRYSSVQRRQLQNRIKSGLTAGSAQASALQNSLGFQQQANRAFQQQSQALADLDLRGAQARSNMEDTVLARKSMASRDALMGAGISNPAALGGLAAKMKGY